MSIKRLTIQFDDSEDKHSITDIPDALKKKRDISETSQPTSIPDSDRIDSDQAVKPPSPPARTGRTYADFLFESKDDPRLMTSVLILLPVGIFAFAGDIDKFEDLLLPGVTGLALVVVWFGIPLLYKLSKYLISRIKR